MVTQLISKSGNAEQQRSAYKLYVSPRAGLALTLATWASLLTATTTQRIRVMWAVISVSAAGILSLNEGTVNADGTAANDFWTATCGTTLPGYFSPPGNGILLGANNSIGIISSTTITASITIWGFIEGTSGPTS